MIEGVILPRAVSVRNLRAPRSVRFRVNELINPYLHQRWRRWRNRIDAWRAAPAEPLLHAAALAALLTVLGWLLLRGVRSHGALLFAAIHAHAAVLIVSAFMLGWLEARRRLRCQRDAWQLGWLAAQPIRESVRHRALAWLLVRRLAGVALLFAALWLAGMSNDAGPAMWPLAGIGSALLAGVLLGWWRDSPRAGRLSGGATCAVTVAAVAGRGTIARWQQAALHGAKRGAALAPGIWLLLLLPMGSYSLLLVPLLLLVVMGLSAFAAGWRLALRVIVDAAQWLAPQPWSSRQFLRAGLSLPLALLCVFALLLLPLAAGLGIVATAGLVALVIALALLQLMVTAASRLRPRRIMPLTLLHVGLLLACLSAVAPAAPLLWLLQLIWLYRKARQ